MAGVRTPSLIIAAGVVAAVVSLAGCGSTPSPPRTNAPTSSLVPPLTGQTDTEWGRIWDGLPADFPVYAGATASEEATTGPPFGELRRERRRSQGRHDLDRRTTHRRPATTMDGGMTALEDGSYAIDGGRDYRMPGPYRGGAAGDHDVDHDPVWRFVPE